MAPHYGYDDEGSVVLVEEDPAPEEVIAEAVAERHRGQHAWEYDDDGRLVKIESPVEPEELTDKELAAAIKADAEANAEASKKGGGKKSRSADFAGGVDAAVEAESGEGDGA